MAQTKPRLRIAGTPNDVAGLGTDALRDRFLIEFDGQGEAIEWTFTDLDRLAIARVMPTQPLGLAPHAMTGTQYFLDRRELGALNVGSAGTIEVDGVTHRLGRFDALYVGRGARSVRFASDGPTPAEFILLSCPAHASHPTTLITQAQANSVALGSAATSNERVIYQYIHEGGVQSCQLVLGFTELKTVSVWNTMPPHTHTRRSEIYFYFDMADGVVMHFLGEPTQTRHLVVRDRQGVLSPPWSVHCGCGTNAYRFLWAMAGENKAFDDMDRVAPDRLR